MINFRKLLCFFVFLITLATCDEPKGIVIQPQTEEVIPSTSEQVVTIQAPAPPTIPIQPILVCGIGGTPVPAYYEYSIFDGYKLVPSHCDYSHVNMEFHIGFWSGGSYHPGYWSSKPTKRITNITNVTNVTNVVRPAPGPTSSGTWSTSSTTITTKSVSPPTLKTITATPTVSKTTPYQIGGTSTPKPATIRPLFAPKPSTSTSTFRTITSSPRRK